MQIIINKLAETNNYSKLFLQTEKNIIPLMGALLCIINLMPIIPSAMANHLSDLFEGFAYLASIPCQSSPKFSNDLLIHLQIGLYCLFNRLYGMFPSNFLSFLRMEYVIKKKTAIYTHTIKPLLDTVKINPLLVTVSKDYEMDPNRWKKMEPHDVVYECSKFSLDFLVKPDFTRTDCQCYNQSNRLMTTSSTSSVPTTFENSSSFMETLVNSFGSVTVSESSRKPLLLQMPRKERFIDMSLVDNNVWSPSVMVLATPPPIGIMPHTPTPSSSMNVNYSSQLGQDGSSPPEAAVEATPETTPMKDVIRVLPANSTAARAIWRPQPSSGCSTPSSPMKKESSPVDWKRFPEPPTIISAAPELNSSSSATTTAISTIKLIRIMNDRSHSIKQIQSNIGGSGRDGLGISSDSGNDLGTNQMVSNTGEFPHDTSSSISIPNSPLPLDAFLSSNNLIIDSSSNTTTQEDQEIIDINQKVVQQHQQQEITIIPDFPTDCDVDCENEVSPCSAGGLHIIDSKSMIDFATRRIRMYSHCIGESSFSAGTSPADICHFIEGYGGAKTFVKKSNSWPDLKMTKISTPPPSAFMPVVQTNKFLGPKDVNGGGYGERMEIIAKQPNIKIQKLQHKIVVEKMNSGTQTIQQWPQFYEHMFLGELFLFDMYIFWYFTIFHSSR